MSDSHRLTRSKALVAAAATAGVLAVAGAAAAFNTGLLAPDERVDFVPSNAGGTSVPLDPTSTVDPGVEIVYQDVYETAPPRAGASRTSVPGDDDDDDDDASSAAPGGPSAAGVGPVGATTPTTGFSAPTDTTVTTVDDDNDDDRDDHDDDDVDDDDDDDDDDAYDD